MRTILRLTPVLLAAFFISSCVKKEVIPPAPPNPIVGAWVLTNADESDGYSWQPFYTGLENGIFYLYGNGTAEYDNGSTVMQGTWYMPATNGPYYDENGNYRNSYHNSLQINLSDAYSHGSVDMTFDYVTFTGNRFIATYDNGSTTERYWFSSY
jgi:hypothetical protein